MSWLAEYEQLEAMIAKAQDDAKLCETLENAADHVWFYELTNEEHEALSDRGWVPLEADPDSNESLGLSTRTGDR